MDYKILSQLITDPENQPHQYVGDARDFENECIKAVWDMATHSLCPDTFDGFELGIIELCERRKVPIDFIPHPTVRHHPAAALTQPVNTGPSEEAEALSLRKVTHKDMEGKKYRHFLIANDDEEGPYQEGDVLQIGEGHYQIHRSIDRAAPKV